MKTEVERGAASERQDVLEELADRIASADDRYIRTPKWLLGVGVTALGASLSLAVWYGGIAQRVPDNTKAADRNAESIAENAKAIRELEKDLTHICASKTVPCRGGS